MTVPHCGDLPRPLCYDAAVKPLLPLLILFWAVCVAVSAEEAPALTAAEKTLIESAYAGQLDRVQSLAAKGTRVDATDETGRTALMWSALRGHAAIVGFLLEKGATVDARDSDGQTALLYACRGSSTEAARLLVQKGAGVNIRSHKQGFTPLIAAAAVGNPEIVQLLLTSGADPTLKDRDGIAAEQFARERGFPAIAELLQNAATPAGQP